MVTPAAAPVRGCDARRGRHEAIGASGGERRKAATGAGAAAAAQERLPHSALLLLCVWRQMETVVGVFNCLQRLRVEESELAGAGGSGRRNALRVARSACARARVCDTQESESPSAHGGGKI